MNRKVPYDRFLILIVLALLTVDLVMVFSASSVVSETLSGSSTAIFTKQAIAVGLGLVAMLLAMWVNYRKLSSPLLLGLGGVTAVGLLGFVLFSPAINGVHRWLSVPGMQFQPSELAKFVVILLTSIFLLRRQSRPVEIDRELLIFAGLLGVVLILLLLEPDFGTALAIVATVAVMLFLGGLSLRYYGAAALLALPAFYFLVYRVPYRWERISAFWDPEADPFGSGYQILQSLIAVGSGGLTGKGLAEGTQKLFFLPEPHTDFIYAVIGEETGLLGCAFVLLLFVLFFWRGVRIALRSDSVFGSYLALGITSMITFQAFFNMSVVLSLCPTKGIPLPFISVGGSSVVIMLGAVGVLLNISRQGRMSAPVVRDGAPGSPAFPGESRDDLRESGVGRKEAWE